MIDTVHLCPVLLILSRVNGSPGRTMNNSVRSDLIYGLPDSFPVSDVYLIIRRADHRAAILNAGIGRLNVRPDNLITSGCRVVDHIMSQLTAYSCHKYFHSCLYAPLYRFCVSSIADLQICRFAGLQICRFADLQICKFADLQVCRFAGLQICRSADSSQYHRGIICTDAARGACCPYTSRIQSVQQQVCQSLLKRSLV